MPCRHSRNKWTLQDRQDTIHRTGHSLLNKRTACGTQKDTMFDSKGRTFGRTQKGDEAGQRFTKWDT